MKKILVTTDLSPESESAFPLARTIASAFHSEICLLTVMENLAQTTIAIGVESPVFPDPELQRELMTQTRSQLNGLLNRAFGEVPCRGFVVESAGSVAGEVVDFARANQIELIVLSTHGRTGLARLITGSVAERVVREAPWPVLVVPVKRET